MNLRSIYCKILHGSQAVWKRAFCVYRNRSGSSVLSAKEWYFLSYRSIWIAFRWARSGIAERNDYAAFYTTFARGYTTQPTGGSCAKRIYSFFGKTALKRCRYAAISPRLTSSDRSPICMPANSPMEWAKRTSSSAHALYT